jgi:hypothetical protein
MSGVVQASWMSRLPAVRDRFHTDVTGLGLTLVALGVGTFLAMTLAGWACHRSYAQLNRAAGPRGLPKSTVSNLLGGVSVPTRETGVVSADDLVSLNIIPGPDDSHDASKRSDCRSS